MLRKGTVAGLMVLMLMFTLHLGIALSSGSKKAGEIVRIGVEDTRGKVQAGQALLVCSYSDSKCKSRMLDGAILRSELDEKVPSLSKYQEIIFYCG
jgi:hypothetical protein